MQKILFYKLTIIGLLALLLLAPLTMIKDTINERERFRSQAKGDIAQSWSESQVFTGPVLVIPFTQSIKKSVYDPQSGKTTEQEEMRRKLVYLIPEQLAIAGNVTTEQRYRGIHSVPVYTANLKVSGHFILPGQGTFSADTGTLNWEEAYISVGVSDIRGIKQQISLKWNGTEKPFQPGAQMNVFQGGVHAVIGRLIPSEPQRYDFDMELALRGMESLRFTPLGKDSKVTLESPWPHPSFTGRFLPESREISDKGFKAVWQTSNFSTNIEEIFNNCTDSYCGKLEDTQFGVSLYDAVDIYQQTERSLKYDFLFIGLTFVAFFLFEVLKRLPIHPIQYGLVGVALAMFYLLLLALSEHIAFALAYFTAGGACVFLLSFYLSYVMRSAWRGVGFGGLLATLYGVLYVLISSEDTSLLMGALLLFIMLTLVMVITRKVNWYQIGDVITQPKKVEA